MERAPKLLIGDRVVVSIRCKDEKFGYKTITTIVKKAILRNCFWEYNYDTPEAFFHRDVQYIERKGKWKRVN